jgi:orotidine-5'-phosphate decarboxylase
MNDMVPSVILALDVKDKTKARATLEAVGEKLEWVKIGLQTYLRDGPEFVREVADSGKNVFLDLKLYDIPNTMVKSLESLVDLPIGMLTLHASAGPEALTKCAQFAEELMPDTILLGVTVLTSMDQDILSSIGVNSSVEKQVNRLASLAIESGIGGIVCSPLELTRLRPLLPDKIKLVTPGIRPSGSEAGDQRRIMTPAAARKAGADYLVIGRPILSHENPAFALEEIQNELNRTSSC